MTFMDRREMICQTTQELLCATGAVVTHPSDEDIAKRARELEERYGLLAAMYIGMLAKRLMRYQDSLRSGHDGRAGNVWGDLVEIAAAAGGVLVWPLEVAQIAERLSELARAEQREGRDILVNQRGEREALAIAVDDARKLRRHWCLIRLIAATAAAIELVRRGPKPPEGSSWQFEQGWAALLEEMRASYSSQVHGAIETVRMIAAGDVSWRDANEYIWRARFLRDLLQYGFIGPDPAPEDYALGWEAACAAFAESEELDWLAQALADAEEACDNARRKAQGRKE